MGIFTDIIEDSLTSIADAQKRGKSGRKPSSGYIRTNLASKSLKKADKALKIKPVKQAPKTITTYMGGVATDFTNMQPGFGAATLGYSVNGNL